MPAENEPRIQNMKTKLDGISESPNSGHFPPKFCKLVLSLKIKQQQVQCTHLLKHHLVVAMKKTCRTY